MTKILHPEITMYLKKLGIGYDVMKSVCGSIASLLLTCVPRVAAMLRRTLRSPSPC
jgi:hypothetical protein